MKPPRSALFVLLFAACFTAGCGNAGYLDPPVNEGVAKEMREGGASAADGGAASVPQGTGWGRLKGVFVFAGSAPDRKPLSITKDQQVCASPAPLDNTLVVDSASKGIANIVVYARSVSRVKTDSPLATPGPTIFDQKNCMFLEHVKVVQTKQKITIKNSDPVGHNTSITPRGDKGTNPNLPPEGTAEYAFNRKQSAPVGVSCSIHPWMKAYILPRPDFYCAVTAENGSFEIPDLPAGEEIEFQVWHERANGKDNALNAMPAWKNGRFKVKIAENGTEDLKQIEVPASAFN